jgi:ATP-dependent Lon protease
MSPDKLADFAAAVSPSEFGEFQDILASEVNIMQTYLNWLTKIPWGQHELFDGTSQESFG